MSMSLATEPSVNAYGNLMSNLHDLLKAHLAGRELSEYERNYLCRAGDFLDGILAGLGEASSLPRSPICGIAWASDQEISFSLLLAYCASADSDLPLEPAALGRKLSLFKDAIRSVIDGNNGDAEVLTEAASFFERYRACASAM